MARLDQADAKPYASWSIVYFAWRYSHAWSGQLPAACVSRLMGLRLRPVVGGVDGDAEALPGPARPATRSRGVDLDDVVEAVSETWWYDVHEEGFERIDHEQAWADERPSRSTTREVSS